jgi:toxin HigB-1
MTSFSGPAVVSWTMAAWPKRWIDFKENGFLAAIRRLEPYRLSIYDIVVIRSFKNAETEAIFNGERSRRFGSIATIAYRKMSILHSATKLLDLNSPGLRLEALKGDRAGQYSIRVNSQYRICFVWHDGEASDVEIVDYH